MKTTIILYWLHIAIGAVNLIKATMAGNEECRVIWAEINEIDASLNDCSELMRDIEDAK